jgi:hypothetical protein
MQQEKNYNFIFIINYFLRPCLARPCFLSLENHQNRFKDVFAKYILRQVLDPKQNQIGQPKETGSTMNYTKNQFLTQKLYQNKGLNRNEIKVEN